MGLAGWEYKTCKTCKRFYSIIQVHFMRCSMKWKWMFVCALADANTLCISVDCYLHGGLWFYIPGMNINALRPRPNRRHFADDIFKCIFENENVWISLKISRKFVPDVRINNIPALVQIMAWRRPGDKPLSESIMVRLPTHICVTRPQLRMQNCYLFDIVLMIYDIQKLNIFLFIPP